MSPRYFCNPKATRSAGLHATDHPRDLGSFSTSPWVMAQNGVLDFPMSFREDTPFFGEKSSERPSF